MCCKTYCSTPIQTSHNESQRVTNGPKTLTKTIQTSHNESHMVPKPSQRATMLPMERGGVAAHNNHMEHTRRTSATPLSPRGFLARRPHPTFPFPGAGEGGAPTRVGDSTFSFRILKLRTPLRGGTRESWRLANVQTP